MNPPYLALGILTLNSRADVKVTEGNGVNFNMEKDAIRVNIAVEGSGRISSLIDWAKPLIGCIACVTNFGCNAKQQRKKTTPRKWMTT